MNIRDGAVKDKFFCNLSHPLSLLSELGELGTCYDSTLDYVQDLVSNKDNCSKAKKLMSAAEIPWKIMSQESQPEAFKKKKLSCDKRQKKSFLKPAATKFSKAISYCFVVAESHLSSKKQSSYIYRSILSTEFFAQSITHPIMLKISNFRSKSRTEHFSFFN